MDHLLNQIAGVAAAFSPIFTAGVLLGVTWGRFPKQYTPRRRRSNWGVES